MKPSIIRLRALEKQLYAYLYALTVIDFDAEAVVKEGKGKKVIVYKYKRKTGYHKKNGHRQLFTEVKIEKINA